MVLSVTRCTTTHGHPQDSSTSSARLLARNSRRVTVGSMPGTTKVVQSQSRTSSAKRRVCLPDAADCGRPRSVWSRLVLGGVLVASCAVGIVVATAGGRADAAARGVETASGPGAGLVVGAKRVTCENSVKGGIGYENNTGRAPNQRRMIGTSVQGRSIWAEHWGSPTGAQVLVIGQTHGDECAPAWVVRELREHSPTTFGVWLIPTLNPDGMRVHQRRNANNVDLNRDGLNQSQPETKALIAFTSELQPAMTVHVHSPYGWIGSHNGGIASTAAVNIAKIAGWGVGIRSGSGHGFLWEGQARAVRNHPSILVEMPAVSRFEAPEVSARARYASISEAARLARAVRVGLERTFAAKASQRGVR